MYKTRFLSPSEKKTGFRHLRLHQMYNGSGFNFIGDTPVTLLAIHFGASNIQLGYIASVMYVAGILLLFVPRIFAGVNFITLQYWAWIIRGLVCFLYSLLWFISGNRAVFIILVTYTLFCITRILGVALYQPLLRMVSSSGNRGEVVAKSSNSFQLSLTAARVVSFIFTSISRFAGIAGLLILQYAGIILNTLAAVEARKIPCRETVYYKKGYSLTSIFRESMRTPELRTAILLNWTNIAMMILFGFLVPFLRIDAGAGTNWIFVFTMITAVSNILAGLYTNSFADRIGSKPLLWGGSLGLAISFLLWFFIPADFPLYIYFILGIVTGFFLYTNNMLTNRLIVRVLPEGDTVGYNSMINFVVAFVSLFVGFAGGYLADSHSLFFTSLPNSYSLTFLFASVTASAALVLSFMVSEPDSRSNRDAISILFSPSNLQAFWQIGRLDKIKDPVRRRTVLLNISKQENTLATEEIRAVLASPLSTGKGEIIKSLFSHPRHELLDDLIREAESSSSYHRLKAIFALGAYPDSKTEELLEKLLFDDNPDVCSNAAKSLGRIGSRKYLDVVREKASEDEDLWNSMNYAIALNNMDREKKFLKNLFSEKIYRQDKRFRQTYYSLVARMLGFSPSLSDIYKSRNLVKGEGLRDFLDEAREHKKFYEEHENFIKMFSEGSYSLIWKRCSLMIASVDAKKHFRYLAESITGYPAEQSDYDDALACVYFTYQILNR